MKIEDDKEDVKIQIKLEEPPVTVPLGRFNDASGSHSYQKLRELEAQTEEMSAASHELEGRMRRSEETVRGVKEERDAHAVEVRAVRVQLHVATEQRDALQAVHECVQAELLRANADCSAQKTAHQKEIANAQAELHRLKEQLMSEKTIMAKQLADKSTALSWMHVRVDELIADGDALRTQCSNLTEERERAYGERDEFKRKLDVRDKGLETSNKHLTSSLDAARNREARLAKEISLLKAELVQRTVQARVHLVSQNGRKVPNTNPARDQELEALKADLQRSTRTVSSLQEQLDKRAELSTQEATVLAQLAERDTALSACQELVRKQTSDALSVQRELSTLTASKAAVTEKLKQATDVVSILRQYLVKANDGAKSAEAKLDNCRRKYEHQLAVVSRLEAQVSVLQRRVLGGSTISAAVSASRPLGQSSTSSTIASPTVDRSLSSPRKRGLPRDAAQGSDNERPRQRQRLDSTPASPGVALSQSQLQSSSAALDLAQEVIDLTQDDPPPGDHAHDKLWDAEGYDPLVKWLRHTILDDVPSPSAAAERLRRKKWLLNDAPTFRIPYDSEYFRNACFTSKTLAAALQR